CYYFSRGEVQAYGNGTTGGIANTILPHTSETMFLPTINHANRYYDTFGEPHELGIKTELARHPAFHPYQEQNGLFCPPPLCMCFKGKEGWAGLGIGTTPGNYRFNSLIWSGYFFSGATLYVDYKGFTTFKDGFESPVLSIVFGYDEYAALEEHFRWCDKNGFSTAKAYRNVRWHRMPVFCGWDEQCVLQYQTGIGAGRHCTQENYEKWIEIQENRGLPFGTLVIDDKWMKNYGKLDIDTDKWPDMKGFIARQHEKGRHVLLWIPYCQTEGLDKSVCVLVDGKPVCADAGNPEYEKILRQSIAELVGNIGADGFKIDWVGGVRFDDSAREGIEFSGLYGIEFLHRFHHIVYDETHKIKPDAMIETQTPNPLFRNCSDVLRLND
ncbi:MAG TPA: glycoside hydrolase family 31 protein, partial [Clostridia bacterium]|nr:glycoside hydrolase family 31 protein [Clostridia bacterium]